MSHVVTLAGSLVAAILVAPAFAKASETPRKEVDVPRVALNAVSREPGHSPSTRSPLPLGASRSALVAQMIASALPGFTRAAMAFPRTQPADFRLDRVLDAACTEVRSIFRDRTLSPPQKRDLMYFASAHKMAEALEVPDNQLGLIYPGYAQISRELAEDVFESGECSSAFKTRAADVERAYAAGQAQFLPPRPGGWRGGIAPAPQAPSKSLPVALAPAAPSKSLPYVPASPQSPR